MFGSLSASIVDLDGIPHVMAMIRDVTAQMQAETKSQELEEELAKQVESQKLIVETSTNLFYAHDIDNNFTYVSPQSSVFFECPPEEVTGSWADFATDNPINLKAYEYTERAITTGERQPPYEFEMRSKNGKITLAEVREAPVVKDGRTVAIVGSLTDITERKRVETILNNENRFLDDILKAIPVSIAVKDEEGYFISCNPAYAKAAGFAMEKIIGHTTSDIYPPEVAVVF